MSRAGAAAVLLLVALPVASGAANDWPQFRYNETHQGSVPAYLNTAFAPVVEEWWKTQLPAPTSGPAIAGGHVYIVDGQGTLHAINLTTGDTLWTAAAGGRVPGTPAIGPTHVYVATDTGRIHSFHRQTGDAQTGYPLSVGPVRGSLMLHEDILYVGDTNGVLHSYFASTRTLRWTFNSRGTFAFGNQSVACPGGEIVSTPAVFDNKYVFFGSTNYCFYAIDKSPGAQTSTALWVFKATEAIRASPAIDLGGRRVIFSDANGWTYAVPAASTGVVTTPLWKYQEPVGLNGVVSEILASPTIWDHLVIVVAFNGNVRALPLNPTGLTNNYTWLRPLGTTVSASPAAANGFILVPAHNHKLFTLNATGFIRDTRTAGEPIETGPAISGKMAVWSSRDGYVHAWGPSQGTKADLVARNATHANLTVGTRAEFQVTIRNAGGTSSVPTTVVLRVGDLEVDEADVPALAPGANQTVALNWTPPLDGAFTLLIRVDPGGLVNEGNEANNDLELEVDVSGEEQGPGPSTSNRPPARATGKGLLSAPAATAASLALLLALLLAPPRRRNG